MRTSLAVVLLLFGLEAAALIPGPERIVTDPTYCPAFGTPYSQDLATDGTDFLSVWIDQTPGREGVYASVMSESGATRPFPPQPVARGQMSVAVATWAGDAYLVVWRDNALGALRMTRLSRDAQVIAPAVTIFDEAAALPNALVGNGRHALLVVSAINKVVALHLTQEGIVERTTEIPAQSLSGRLSAAVAGETFVVVWSETEFAGPGSIPRTRLRAMRIDDAVTIDLAVDLPAYASQVSATSDGSRIGVAFVARRTSVEGPNSLRTFTIDAGNMVVRTEATASTLGDFPRAAATARGFVAGLLVWSGRETSLEVIPFDGSARTATPVSMAGGADLMLAATSRMVLATWSDYRLSPPGEYSNRQMFGIPLDAAAVLPAGEVVPVAISAIPQLDPVVATGGEVALLVWNDMSKTNHGEVRAARIDGHVVLDPVPLLLGAGVRLGSKASAVFTGEGWLVAWASASQPSEVSIRFVTLNGEVVESIVRIDGAMPAFASNGVVTALALWSPEGLIVQRFSRGGERVGAPIPLKRGGSAPAIATDGRQFLLAWTEGSNWWQFPSPNRRDVVAIRLDETGVPFGAPIEIATGPSDEGDPLVASDGRDFLVAFRQNEESVRGKRVLHEGVLAATTSTGDGKLIAQVPSALALAAAGTGYVAAVGTLEDLPDRLWVVTLDADGAPASPPTLVAQSDAPWLGASIATVGRSLVIAYPRTVAGPPYENIPRVFLRSLSEATRRRAVR